MDKIKHLFSFFLKIAFAIFFIVLIIRIVAVLPRTQGVVGSASKDASSTPKDDILPSPRKYSGFFTNVAATTSSKVYGNTFVAPATFVYGGPITSIGGTTNNNATVIKSPDGYTYNTYDYSAYPTTLDEKGNYVIGFPKTSVQTQSPGAVNIDTDADRRLTIRNLSIYQGGHIYTGLAFVGEARSMMFRDGKFSIIVVDRAGRLVGISTAVAQTKWTVPGWVRFETKINYSLPSNAPCTMIFEEALTSSEQKLRAPNHVSFGVRCN